MISSLKSQRSYCLACADACPGKAVFGDNCSPEKNHEEFLNAWACRPAACEIALIKTLSEDYKSYSLIKNRSPGVAGRQQTACKVRSNL
jgi:hypothetical protein